MREPADHLPVAPIAFEVLLSVARGPQHGYGIIQDIGQRTGGELELATSTLYSTLARLEEAGLLRESKRRLAESGGPPRKYYEITKLGQEVARLELRRLQRVAAQARRRFGSALGEAP
jgi:DNA-binding PadR family transcriptional regulator